MTMPPQRNAQPAYDEGVLQFAIQGTIEDHKESEKRVIVAFGVPRTTVQYRRNRALPRRDFKPNLKMLGIITTIKLKMSYSSMSLPELRFRFSSTDVPLSNPEYLRRPASAPPAPNPDGDYEFMEDEERENRAVVEKGFRAFLRRWLWAMPRWG
ncbi:hypothetical protein EJ02DRAFT_482785 [Clathrospora elynae]|uniref:HTH psq-type domain-containing protein n=1 Tax=Clathrospora elynae TaxID=706981 RepID=A0A6A5S8M7_9PLEO|nr:hypothetical protein EJ02DRAFT_482785 [Clathrospora elynae]